MYEPVRIPRRLTRRGKLVALVLSVATLIAIVVTGYGTVKDAVEAIKRGASDFVNKPFQIDELLHVLDSALAQARAAAGDLPVHVAGGPRTINQYLAAGLIDELRLQIVPIVLGAGERLFDGVPLLELEQIAVRPVSLATHVRYRVVR